MANQLQVTYATPSLNTIYFVIVSGTGTAWNGTAFEALNASHWSTYAIAGSDSAGIGLYLATFPSGIAVGDYTAFAYLKLGGSVASTDTRLGAETQPWDGTHFGPGSGGSSGPVTLDLTQASLPFRALDTVADNQITVGDALASAVCAAAGKGRISGSNYLVQSPSTGTVIRTFLLDNPANPTMRT